MDVKEGDIVSGKYRIERVLGRGAMGIVVAAWHLQLEQPVALKFLSPEALDNPEAVKRFAREARAAASIRSEHVARVIDVGALETGAPFMVMEYLEGRDLSQYMGQCGTLPIAEAAELTLQACEALAEAHSLGIVHRDLKPANLFLARYADRTCLKILDFGISKIRSAAGGGTDFQITQAGDVMGSPYYMSPEQMRSTHGVDTRTDIWAIGVVLYELVAGRVPFHAPTMPQLCGMILTEPPPPLAQFRPDVPPRFEALLLRCLEKEPDRRFAHVGQLAAALAEFAPPSAGSRSLERILRLSPAATLIDNAQSRPGELAASARNAADSGWGRTANRGRSRSIWGIVVAIVVIGAGVVAFYLRKTAASSTSANSAVAAPSLVQSPPQVATAGVASAEPTAVSQPRLPASSGFTEAAIGSAAANRRAPVQPRAPAPKAGPKHLDTLPVAPSPAASAAPPGPAPPPPRPPINPLDGRL